MLWTVTKTFTCDMVNFVLPLIWPQFTGCRMSSICQPDNIFACSVNSKEHSTVVWYCRWELYACTQIYLKKWTNSWDYIQEHHRSQNINCSLVFCLFLCYLWVGLEKPSLPLAKRRVCCDFVNNSTLFYCLLGNAQADCTARLRQRLGLIKAG